FAQHSSNGSLQLFNNQLSAFTPVIEGADDKVFYQFGGVLKSKLAQHFEHSACHSSTCHKLTLASNSHLCASSAAARVSHSRLYAHFSYDCSSRVRRHRSSYVHTTIRGFQMKKQFHLTTAASIVVVSAAVALSAALTTAPELAMADDCPNGGTVRFGVEP